MCPKIDVMERECKNYNIWMHLNRPRVKEGSVKNWSCGTAQFKRVNLSFHILLNTVNCRIRGSAKLGTKFRSSVKLGRLKF
jgi:hypothetical protein